MFVMLVYFVMLWCSSVDGLGLMLLYRPRDISKDCAVSNFLRYDLSYGMGMSDTITLVFRTLFDVDYECVVDIAAERKDIIMLIVVRYPNLISLNCEVNKNAITLIQYNRCYRLCDRIKEKYSTRTIFPMKGKFRFRFISNSSVNSDLNAYMYQVTATAARPSQTRTCHKRNETSCEVAGKYYCFTSGVVCDGIQNCGLEDWFDERKSMCDLPQEKLGFAPVIAVTAALLCGVLVVGHVLLRCLPPQANSFFIFNANEDNRLCIDPKIKPRGNLSPQLEKPRAMSLVPVYSSSSTGSESGSNCNINMLTGAFKSLRSIEDMPKESETPRPRRKITMKSMTSKIQEKFRLVTGSRTLSTTHPLKMLEMKTMEI